MQMDSGRDWLVTMTDEIICPYKHKCTDHQKLCHNCTHNNGKKSYYQPEYDPSPYYPWITWDPYTSSGTITTWYTT